MPITVRSAALALSLLVSGAALAQQPAVDPATLASAREVVTRMSGDRDAVLHSMAAPMTALIGQFGVREPDRAKVLVDEVILPTLGSHYDELLEIQARSYASVLSAADLGAISAFYATPAGKNLAAAQPRLAQAQMSGMTQWMGAIAPELQSKLALAVQKHGWAPAGGTPAGSR